jgi:hypothetical protein
MVNYLVQNEIVSRVCDEKLVRQPLMGLIISTHERNTGDGCDGRHAGIGREANSSDMELTELYHLSDENNPDIVRSSGSSDE